MIGVKTSNNFQGIRYRFQYKASFKGDYTSTIIERGNDFQSRHVDTRSRRWNLIARRKRG